MRHKSQAVAPDYALYKQKRKVVRSGMWLAFFTILLVISIVLYFMAPAAAGFVIIFMIILVILTFGLILLNDEFRAYFGDGSEQAVTAVQNVAVALIIAFSILLAITIVFYVLRRLKFKKMVSAQAPVNDALKMSNTQQHSEVKTIKPASLIDSDKQ